MSCSRNPQVGRITPEQIDAYEAKGRLERARAIRRALRRLTGRHERAIG